MQRACRAKKTQDSALGQGRVSDRAHEQQIPGPGDSHSSSYRNTKTKGIAMRSADAIELLDVRGVLVIEDDVKIVYLTSQIADLSGRETIVDSSHHSCE